MTESEDKNWPDSQLYIEGEGFLETITSVKEGAKDGGGADGVTLTISTSVRTRNAVLMMGSTRSANQTIKFIWDEKQQVRKINGITKIETNLEFGKFGHCFFVGFDDEVEASLKSIRSLEPEKTPDLWKAKFGIYIKEPTEHFLYSVHKANKSTIEFKFIQRQADIDGPRDDGDND